MMARPDIVLYDREGQLTTLVEVKNKPGTSRDWAANFRRNILAHGGLRTGEYFLLMTPDRLYLWKDAGGQLVPIEPTYEIDARPLLRPYFSRARVDPATVSGEAFELIVASWLADLTRSLVPTEPPVSEEGWLAESGFLRAVKEGRVEHQAAA